MKPSIFDIQHLYLKDYLFRLFPSGKLNGKEFVIGDIQGNAGESLSFNVEKGCGKDFATGEEFTSIVELVRAKFGLDEQAAFKKIEEDWDVKSTAVVPADAAPKKPEIRQLTFDKKMPLAIPGNIISRFGEPVGKWLYQTPDGQGVGWIVRFDTPEGKQYFPFVYGEDKKWHMKGFTKPRPLYNLPDLIGTKNIILIVEGEKAAEAAQQLFPSLTVTTWPGGAAAINQIDWSKLQGKKVLIWRDNDEAGEGAQQKIGDILLKLDCQVRILKDDAFKGRPEKWDAADLALSREMVGQEALNWIKDNIIEYQRGGADSSGSTTEEPKSAQINEDPLNKHYRCLGMLGNKYAIYSYHSGQVEYFSANQLSKKTLIAMVIGDISHWNRTEGIGGDDKISWDAIVGVISRDCCKQGQFDNERLRGCGAWEDKGRVIFNTGKFLYISGEVRNLDDFESYYIYISRIPVVETLEEQLPQEALDNLLSLLSMFRWEYVESAMLLAGWLMVAPLSGMLKWRPHIYVTGQPGTGKSTAFEIMARVLGRIAIAAQGRSSEAGIRQSIDIDTLPVIFDEAETNNKLDELNNESLMSLARASSAGGAGGIRKGTSDQTGSKNYVTKSCFCFNSITASVKHASEFRRITMLPMRKRDDETEEEALESFAELSATIRAVFEDPDFADKFIATSVNRAKTVTESFEVIKECSLRLKMFRQELVEQLAMLLAGYHALRSEKVITIEEATDLIKGFNWQNYVPDNKTDNHQQLLARLAQQTIDIDNEKKGYERGTFKRSVAELLQFLSYPHGTEEHSDGALFKEEIAVRALGKLGLKYNKTERLVYISNQSDSLARLLSGSQWGLNWTTTFKSIPGAHAPVKPVYFGNTVGTRRAIAIPLDAILMSEE